MMENFALKNIEKVSREESAILLRFIQTDQLTNRGLLLRSIWRLPCEFEGPALKSYQKSKVDPILFYILFVSLSECYIISLII